MWLICNIKSNWNQTNLCGIWRYSAHNFHQVRVKLVYMYSSPRLTYIYVLSRTHTLKLFLNKAPNPLNRYIYMYIFSIFFSYIITLYFAKLESKNIVRCSEIVINLYGSTVQKRIQLKHIVWRISYENNKNGASLPSVQKDIIYICIYVCICFLYISVFV